MSPYLQIGADLFPVDQNGCIGFIEYGSHSTQDHLPYRLISYIAVTTNVLVTDGDVSVSHKVEYEIGSPEADALISWLNTNTQVLLPLESEQEDKPEKPSLSPETIAVAVKALRDYLENQEIFRKDDKGSLAATYELQKIMDAHRELDALIPITPDYDLGDLDDNPF